MWYILDENDNPIKVGIRERSEFFESNRDKIVVSCTKFDDDIKLSTVFLGLDHNFSGEGGPVLYESLWFGGVHANEMRRYRTKQEALSGHEEMIKEYKESVK
jgi:hypothetical protein